MSKKKTYKLTLNGFESRRFCEFRRGGAGVPRTVLYNNNIINMGRTRGRRLCRHCRRRRLPVRHRCSHRRRRAVQNRLSKDFSENHNTISTLLAVPFPSPLPLDVSGKTPFSFRRSFLHTDCDVFDTVYTLHSLFMYCGMSILHARMCYHYTSALKINLPTRIISPHHSCRHNSPKICIPLIKIRFGILTDPSKNA